MDIPFFNYKKYCKDINYYRLFDEVLESGYLIGGPFVKAVEAKLEDITGIKHCISVANATDAMEIIFSFLKGQIFLPFFYAEIYNSYPFHFSFSIRFIKR